MVKFGEDSIECNQARVRMATFLSGGASAAGFAGGVVLTVMAAIVLMSTDASSLMIGYCLIMSAVFLLVFLTAYGLLSYQRTSPALPEGANRLTFGYVRIYKTIRQVRRLKTMFYYLSAWFILGDGLTSASNIAILLAQSQLKATNDALIGAAVLQYVCAGVSMWFWIWLQNNKGVRPLQVIIANSCLFGMIPVYCLLGLIESNPVGLKQTWEMYMLASLFGLFVGAIYSSNRVVILRKPSIITADIYIPIVTLGERISVVDRVSALEKGRLEAVEFYKNEQAEKELKKRQRQSERQSGCKSESTGTEIASIADSEKNHGEDV
ncbi:Autophagy protein 22 [Mortierella alpina]|nr:Autophagy protein 22 [Mortierella alpina]